MSYVAPIAVLKEAGLYNREVGEVLSGTVDGENATFTTLHKPLVPTQGTDTVLIPADVAAYVDGVPVTVTSVQAATGAVLLATAPAQGTEVTLDYAYSPVSLTDVASAIEEADDAINEAARDAGTVEESSATARKIARFYAAGLLMSREYGLESITEESTKEGERKLSKAEKWLTDFRARLVSDDAADVSVPRSTEDKRLFQSHDSSTNTWGPLTDTSFRVNRRL